MTRNRLLLLVLFAAMASLFITAKVYAQDPAPTPASATVPSDNEVNLVAKKLYCPVCPNTPLDVCETQACKDWRAQIRDQLASGWTEKEVMDYFVTQYGERVLAEPERGGFTSLVWMLPLLIVALGLVFVGLVLKSWRASRLSRPLVQTETQTGTGISKQILDKIEAEIRKVD
ncbi:MAG: cytochrome c-type biogenesis protein CcmH [Bellilinea sp.]